MQIQLPSLLLALSAALPAAGQAADGPSADLPWDAARAEHLLTRAGFGASGPEVAAAVARGPEAVVDQLLAGEGWMEEPFYSRLRGGMELRQRMQQLPEDERREVQRRMRREDEAQVRDFLGWWVERMLDGEDDLRERLTLFWHGHFTSSMQDVKNSHEMILQNQLLRRHALGSFADLLHAIARDPAMLEYLDNDTNRKRQPNENFARELMELFTLGEGHYTENDVKEAARAFTGWTDRDGNFRFAARLHDRGKKTVLGETGRFDGDDVLDLLLAHPQCARHLAGKLLRYFEGVTPAEERCERYAAFLRANDYEIAPFVRKLFLDPDFYRDEVVGARIASPVDYLVGAARRLGIAPPARLILVGASALGERLFYPPNVKGWEGGAAWVTTSALLQRANLAGALLGEVALEDFLRHDPLADPAAVLSEGAAGDGRARARDASGQKRRKRMLGALRELREVERFGWRPRMNLSHRLREVGATTDAEVVAALCAEVLAVEVGAETLGTLTGSLARLRAEHEVEGELLAAREAEPVLRALAHLILSLPEAHLH